MIRGIHELYRHRCNEGGNINEHLPLLYMLSLDSDSVVEFGIDRGVSTSALIAGQDTRISLGLPASYHGYDVRQECAGEVERLMQTCARSLACVYTKASSTSIPAVSTDMLFIDSLHTEEMIRQELALHLGGVRKYVVLHDTVAFGENGEKPGTRGILYGIGALLTPAWLKVYDSPRNNGLAAFKRMSP